MNQVARCEKHNTSFTESMCPDCFNEMKEIQEALLRPDGVIEFKSATQIMMESGATIQQAADKMVRSRIERLADKILTATDLAGREDGITVAEIMGVLEMAKSEISRRAFE